MIVAQVHNIAESTRAFANFLKHCKESRGLAVTRDLVPIKILNEELAKYGATFKETKKWQDRYVKFKSHKHLTMFILRWS